MTVYTYIRVSSVDQNEVRQVKTMKEKDIQKEHMYIDKVSGKNTDRPQYQLLKETIQEGDTIILLHTAIECP